MRVLLTGFEPFRGETINPSWETCKALQDLKLDIDIVVKQLPVAFDEAREKAIAYCEEVDPDVILHLGEAGGYTHVAVERIAINCDDAKVKDNKGAIRENRVIEREGQDGYFATIPVVRIFDAMKKAGIPAVISNSAGTYLCNHVLYGTLHHIRTHALPIQAGFIHVPYLPQQAVDKPGKASMSLDLMVDALTVALKECASVTR
ncbi:MAG: pyroglutamyl-peptidase I [Theionarchaea archaeon]|nr:pyroglutamyl-peptidase I [Theionarchaea archaeon]MBU7000198.1 pyroglutamyl-peptidase I [Theionarchaea archaeon]MBU7020915.1 pyroglutamyl-peptidase I [Theionarchaea archaeon]MBU7040537.1 pyroglutamyl-peptidase I [Theionarchaea archaeon]